MRPPAKHDTISVQSVGHGHQQHVYTASTADRAATGTYLLPRISQVALGGLGSIVDVLILHYRPT